MLATLWQPFYACNDFHVFHKSNHYFGDSFLKNCCIFLQIIPFIISHYFPWGNKRAQKRIVSKLLIFVTKHLRLFCCKGSNSNIFTALPIRKAKSDPAVSSLNAKSWNSFSLPDVWGLHIQRGWACCPRCRIDPDIPVHVLEWWNIYAPPDEIFLRDFFQNSEENTCFGYSPLPDLKTCRMKITLPVWGWRGMIHCPLGFDHAVKSHLCHDINESTWNKIILSNLFKRKKLELCNF